MNAPNGENDQLMKLEKDPIRMGPPPESAEDIQEKATPSSKIDDAGASQLVVPKVDEE